MTTNSNHPWWQTESLVGSDRGLMFSGQAVADLARGQTPVYIYSEAVIRQNLAELRAALSATGLPYKIHYAIKANRFAPLVRTIRAEADIGIDATSPREVALAMSLGFASEEISVTMSMPSGRDLQAYAAHGVHLNLDTGSALRRWAATPGGQKTIGLRMDPGPLAAYGENPKLSYGNSKFGFDPREIKATVAYAMDLGLSVDTLHAHVGWGLPQTAYQTVDAIYGRMAALAAEIPTLRTINVGGGLAPRHVGSDRPLSLGEWSELLRKNFGPLGLRIACESGTYVVAKAGLLVAEVNTVERRGQSTWLGLDCGHNVNCYAAHYSVPHQLVHVSRPLAAAEQVYNIAGNINESVDVFGRGISLPEVQEGGLIAFYPAGAYGSGMASDHCLKGLPAELMIEDPLPA